jgi:glycosyltransferase involved in cell wall biosynthesis
MPRVSVVLPNYNYARYLKERVRSILGQTFADLELLYVDDGSTDASNQVMTAFSSDPRLQMRMHTENSGRVYQRWNEGAALASGQWLWFAGADDSAQPDFLEKMLALAERHPRAAILHCRQATMDSGGRLLAVSSPEPFMQAEYAASAGDDIALMLVRHNFLASASSMLLRRDAFEGAGGFDSRLWLAADWDLYLSMLRLHDIAYLCEALSCYRLHANTVTKSTRTAVSLMENAYCVARAACWMQEHPQCRHEMRKASLRMLRARLFELFADSAVVIPTNLHFAAQAVHDVIPDPRLRIWSALADR